jgi:Ricin-type beta-trefoil lectin domain
VKLLSLFAVRIASISVIGSAISLSMLASSALAENFQVSGNKSLNTNNKFSYIDGHPRMAVYDSNNSDPDQNFDRLAGKWGVLFRNRSTNMCINAYYNRDGGAVSNWPCDANDPAQNFDLLGQGGNIVLLRKSNTNFCLNVPYHVNSGQVTAWTCNTKDVDQRFTMMNIVTPPPPPPKKEEKKPQLVTYTYSSVPSLYEAWIVSRKRSSGFNSDVGHAFTSIIKKDRRKETKYIDGVYAGDQIQEDKWKVWHTYGYWPGGVLQNGNGLFAGSLLVDNGCSSGEKQTECQDVRDILAGVSISNRGQAVRKARISESRAYWIDNNRNFTGCTAYWAAGTVTNKNGIKSCNCVTLAASQWYEITARRDNFPQNNLGNYAPDSLVDEINRQNQSTGNQFIDNGNTWN